MKNIALTCLTALTLAIPSTARANDIVDFLRALNGARSIPVRQARVHDHGRHHAHGQYLPPPVSTCPQDRLRQSQLRQAQLRQSRLDALSRSRYSRRSLGNSGLSFQVSFGGSPVYTQAPPQIQQVPVIPSGPVFPPPPSVVQPIPHVGPALPALPRPGDVSHLAHEYGSVVTCPVPLATCVKVRDECRIAPNAVPTVIAVRCPHLGRFRSRDCVERCVYVQVMAPPCPPQRVRVSPCRTKIRLDYGRYEIDIVSRRGVIEIDYDN